jgi:hypothetical protein
MLFLLPLRMLVLIAMMLSSCAILLSPVSLKAQTLTFDDVITNAQGLNNNFTNYGGFVFEGFNVATTTSLGAGTNAVSGTKFALGREDLSAIYVLSGAFNFLGASLSYRQFDVLNPDNGPVGINVVAYRAGFAAPAFTQFVTLTDVAQPFVFNFTNIEELVFETDPLTANGRSAALAMDNATIAAVPEPATFAMMSIGMACLLIAVRRKRCS